MTGTKKSWRDVLRVHPAAELFPLMGPDELRALWEDIKTNGLKYPITIWYPGKASLDIENYYDYKDCFLLDGRNRLDAMEIVGIELVDDTDCFPASEKLVRVEFASELGVAAHTLCGHHYAGIPGVDPYTYALSLNILRRHLTSAQKGDLTEKLLKAKPERSDRAIAKDLKIDHKTVATKRKKLEATGEIPHIETRTDTRGRSQPAKKSPTKLQQRAAQAAKRDGTDITAPPPAEGARKVQIEVSHYELPKPPPVDVTYYETPLAPPKPADPEIAKLAEQVASKAPEPPAAADSMDLLKKAFLDLSPRDRFAFREWVNDQICGEVLH